MNSGKRTTAQDIQEEGEQVDLTEDLGKMLGITHILKVQNTIKIANIAKVAEVLRGKVRKRVMTMIKDEMINTAVEIVSKAKTTATGTLNTTSHSNRGEDLGPDLKIEMRRKKDKMVKGTKKSKKNGAMRKKILINHLKKKKAVIITKEIVVGDVIHAMMSKSLEKESIVIILKKRTAKIEIDNTIPKTHKTKAADKIKKKSLQIQNNNIKSGHLNN